jgi:hypothetical protein
LDHSPPHAHTLTHACTSQVCEVPTGDVLVGGGDGSLQIIRTVSEPSPANPKMLKKMPAITHTCELEGAITSITLAEMSSKGFVFYVGTAACNICKWCMCTCGCLCGFINCPFQFRRQSEVRAKHWQVSVLLLCLTSLRMFQTYLCSLLYASPGSLRSLCRLPIVKKSMDWPSHTSTVT